MGVFSKCVPKLKYLMPMSLVLVFRLMGHSISISQVYATPTKFQYYMENCNLFGCCSSFNSAKCIKPKHHYKSQQLLVLGYIRGSVISYCILGAESIFTPCRQDSERMIPTQIVE